MLRRTGKSNFLHLPHLIDCNLRLYPTIHLIEWLPWYCLLSEESHIGEFFFEEKLPRRGLPILALSKVVFGLHLSRGRCGLDKPNLIEASDQSPQVDGRAEVAMIPSPWGRLHGETDSLG